MQRAMRLRTSGVVVSSPIVRTGATLANADCTFSRLGSLKKEEKAIHQSVWCIVADHQVTAAKRSRADICIRRGIARGSAVW